MSSFLFLKMKMEKEMQIVEQFVLSLICQPTGTEVKRLLLHPHMSKLFHCHWKKSYLKHRKACFCLYWKLRWHMAVHKMVLKVGET